MKSLNIEKPASKTLGLRHLVACAFAALGMAFHAVPSANANEPLPGWKHSGDFTVLTTPDGANLPAGVVVEEFPMLVRLHRDGFDFLQAKTDGGDVRFTTTDGKLLAHQIEEWDAAKGEASVWVRVPLIRGNERLVLRMHWGKPDAASASDGAAVFNESNGYLSVWHMAEAVRDEVGTLEAKDSGTTPTPGVIGKARHFTEGAKILCGDKITAYPVENAPHTTELWFRSKRSNVNLIGWGVQKQQGKVVMQLRGPPHISMDCWFSDGNVKSEGLLALGEWHHAVFAYESGNARLYVNGVLAGIGGRGTPLNVRSPAMLSLGGWSGDFNFHGDLDEVRVSKVTRSADWVKLQYENQKPMQTLVGPLMRAGGGFAVVPEQATVAEGGTAVFSARADHAQKLYWSLVRDGREEVVAVDRYAFNFSPGRVAADTPMTLRLKAVFRGGVKTRDIPVFVKEAIPDPEFTLTAPAAWDGRTPIELAPAVLNLAAMQKAGAGEVQMQWSAGPFATVKEAMPGKLRLLAAQNSGPLTVTATLSNGGTLVSRSVSIKVSEPQADAWVARIPERDEKPEEGQFYARDDKNEGTLHYNGTLAERADEVFLKIFAADKPFATVKARPAADLSYALTAKLKPGLVKYRVEFGTLNGGKETMLDKVGDLVCGDAFLIEGQSNAEALDLREEAQKPRETNEWIRTFAGPKGGDDGTAWVRDYEKKTEQAGGKRPSLWRLAVWQQKPPEHDARIGWWGMELAKRLVQSRQVPICIINGALGGTRIDQHQRNPANPADLSTIYGKWFWRLQQARLTHGIRGILWHQGENDQPADTPDGDYGWVNYHRYFIEMAAGWRRDLPNARRYFVFQIWPNSCGMGGRDGAGDRLRERQRTLPALFSNLSTMSTLGIRPPGGCHFPREGYDEFARLMHPLIERDAYGQKPAAPITPPNLQSATVTAPDTIALHFDQPVKWNDALTSQFYLDGEKDRIASGSVAGSVLTLKLKEPLREKTITYLKEASWSQDNLLWGENGIAALTFCEVAIAQTK
jgi:hypothetical protein